VGIFFLQACVSLRAVVSDRSRPDTRSSSTTNPPTSKSNQPKPNRHSNKPSLLHLAKTPINLPSCPHTHTPNHPTISNAKTPTHPPSCLANLPLTQPPSLPFTPFLRYDARIEVEKALEGKGLLRGKENNKMRLGICSRSGDVIEPYLTPQWWVCEFVGVWGLGRVGLGGWGDGGMGGLADSHHHDDTRTSTYARTHSHTHSLTHPNTPTPQHTHGPTRYVNCDGMAKAAVEKVRSGELKIQPAFHEATWYRWLDNIRCVSGGGWVYVLFVVWSSWVEQRRALRERKGERGVGWVYACIP
jgi:hypothetical protein